MAVEYTWFKDGQKIIFGGEKEERRKRDVKLEHFTADVGNFNRSRGGGWGWGVGCMRGTFSITCGSPYTNVFENVKTTVF